MYVLNVCNCYTPSPALLARCTHTVIHYMYHVSSVPDVTVDITTSGSAVVGMSTTLTCTVSGADNLAATISFAFTGPNTDSGTGTSLQLLLGPLDLSDAGRYTCTATISSGLLENNLVPTDMVDVNLQSENKFNIKHSNMCSVARVYNLFLAH